VQVSFFSKNKTLSTVKTSFNLKYFPIEMGANEYEVCIGNEAVSTKLQSDEDAEKKLLGMDLVR